MIKNFIICIISIIFSFLLKLPLKSYNYKSVLRFKLSDKGCKILIISIEAIKSGFILIIFIRKQNFAIFIKNFIMKFLYFVSGSLLLSASIVLGGQYDLDRRDPICFVEGRCIERQEPRSPKTISSKILIERNSEIEKKLKVILAKPNLI